MSREPADLTTLVEALRNAQAALEAGEAIESVRSELRPHEDGLRTWYAQAHGLSAVEQKHIQALLHENELLSRNAPRLGSGVEVLLDVIRRGAGPEPDRSKD